MVIGCFCCSDDGGGDGGESDVGSGIGGDDVVGGGNGCDGDRSLSV